MRQRLDLRIVRVVDSSDPTVLHLEMEFDPRRYKWLEHDGEMCLYDRLEKAVIPERVLHEMVGQMDGLPIYYQPPLIRDSAGIVHIRAENEHDLFFAQGYSAARDRLFQLEL